MTTPPHASVTLPTAKLLGVAIGGPAVAAVCWVLVTWPGPWDTAVLLTGLLGIAVVAVVSIAATVAMRPWHSRPILAWGGVLIGASIGRAVIAMGICLLLYFATRQPAGPLLLGGLAGLIPVLVGETALAARRFKREDT